jgi:hypothetical protein
MPNLFHSPLSRGLRAACVGAALGMSTLLAPTAAVAADATVAPASSRFATDAAVREGMAAIRTLMAAQEAAIRADKLGASDYVALSKAIDAAMQAHLVRRSLPKAAAVAFNGSIWQDLSYCVGLMRDGRSAAVQRSGALGVQQVLRNYPQYFEHPGW